MLALVENSDTTLSVMRMDIPNSEVSIAELEAMVDNHIRSDMFMQSVIINVIDIPKV